MAYSSSEFITDVTVTVDEALYKDTRLLKGILQGYASRREGSCYHVSASYREIEDLCMKLSTLERHTPTTKDENPALEQHTTRTKYKNPSLEQLTPSTKYKNTALEQHTTSTKYKNPALEQHTTSTKYKNPALEQHTTRTKYKNPALEQPTPSTTYEDLAVKQAFNNMDDGSNHQGKHFPAPVPQLEVSGVVMDYIQQKRSKEFDRIQGSDFWIDIQHSSLGRARSDPSAKAVVVLKPRHRDITQARAHLARERFVTFYQRIATDLQVRMIRIRPQDCRTLEGTFSELLIEPDPSQDKVKVTGPFVQILRLEKFLSGGSSTPTDRQSPQPSSPPRRGGGTVSGTLPKHSREPEEDESCPICLNPIDTKKTLRCQHSFCKDCVEQAFRYKPVCPTCGTVYGALRGTQPDGGTMSHNKQSSSLPGYEKYKTIVIHYNIPSGIQKEEHPSPGKRYEGAARTAYLPDSTEGRRVLDLLRRAFDQRLIFTIGRSTTSGRNNVVTWNDIHHKTSVSGGTTCYGYPDPDYLDRVKDELKVKGIE